MWGNFFPMGFWGTDPVMNVFNNTLNRHILGAVGCNECMRRENRPAPLGCSRTVEKKIKKATSPHCGDEILEVISF
jgi:hypothetical protein